ncbi:MAG: hypothetical protein QXS27_03860 [Candidatus Jordarchaeaceae archaeon]
MELRRRTGLGPRRIWWLLKASRANQPPEESYSPTTIRNMLIRTNNVKISKREKKTFNPFFADLGILWWDFGASQHRTPYV